MSRVAVFIDGDNVSSVHAARISSLADEAGRVDIHRVYADATNGSGWCQVPGVRLLHAGTGKNAADLLLSIDAMELVLSGTVDVVFIASSDSDFTHLAFRLRERGIAVIGLGEDKAPETFRAACGRFELLPPVRPAPGTTTSSERTELDRKICEIIEHDGAKNRSIHLSGLGNRLKEDHGISRSDLPKATLKAYLAGKSNLYLLYPTDAPSRVRLIPAARPKQDATAR